MSTVEELTFQRDRWIKRTWCEIDLDCLKDNITLIQSLAKKTVIGVVKANAYGHGDVMIAKELPKRRGSTSLPFPALKRPWTCAWGALRTIF